MAAGWRKLNVGVVGGGIGGMCVAIALRRSGHDVVIYERSDFAGEVGASVSCAANGTRWLHEWEIDVAKGDPVILKQLINRDWKTGEPVSEYSLDDYEERWGHVYNMFHRQYMHAMLKDAALDEEGKGKAAKLVVNHKVRRSLSLTLTLYEAILTRPFSAKPSIWKQTPSPSRMEFLWLTISLLELMALALSSAVLSVSTPSVESQTNNASTATL
jgi:hypothetical protein